MIYIGILPLKKEASKFFPHLIYKTLVQVKKNTVTGQTNLNPNTERTLHDATLHRNQMLLH